MPQSFHELLWQARKLVAYTNRSFALLTGVSLRTVERHSASGGISHSGQTQRLIAAVYPKDAELARQLAAAAGTSLEALGIARPPSQAGAPAATPQPSSVRPEHADSVLLAAANAIDMVPRAVRPAVAAAFAKAKELGVSAAGLADHLAREEPPARPKPEVATNDRQP